MPTVFLTGASGVGKSTTMHSLIEHGFAPSPLYLTRAPRAGETEGIDAHFISKEAFARRILNSFFLEKTLTEAQYGDEYYGSPAEWIDTISAGEHPDTCATPANVAIVARAKQNLAKRGIDHGYTWVNLYAPVETRSHRIVERDGEGDVERLALRLYSGASHGIAPDACLNIDTSTLSSDEVVKYILANTK